MSQVGLLLILPWVLVDQFYLKLRRTKIVISLDRGPLSRATSALSLASSRLQSGVGESQCSRGGRAGARLTARSRSLERILDSSSGSSWDCRYWPAHHCHC